MASYHNAVVVLTLDFAIGHLYRGKQPQMRVLLSKNPWEGIIVEGVFQLTPDLDPAGIPATSPDSYTTPYPASAHLS